MLAVCASTTYSLPVFDACVALNLVWTSVWMVVSAGLGYSTVKTIAPEAAVNVVSLLICAGVRAVSGEAAAAIALLLVLGTGHVVYFIH